MKLALPDKFEYKSENKKFTLIYKPKSDIIVKHPKGKWVWKSVQPGYPSEVILAPEAKLAYFLGSYGDAGMGLGKIDLYDLETGKLLHHFETSQVIPNLEELSKSYRDMTNFPWISATKLKAGGNSLEIKVCNQVIVKVDAQKKEISQIPILKWFSKIGCSELLIQHYSSLSANTPSQQLTIKDPDYIRSLQVQINQIPVEGDIMVDMSENAQLTTLTFSCDGKKEAIEFYDGRIKTPATSFFSRSENYGKDLWTETQLLFTKAEVNSPTPFFLGHKVDFGDFSLTYLGSEDRTPEGTTASSWVQSFQLKEKNSAKEKILEVYSGQLPPQPVNFQLDGKTMTLHTFQFKGERIDPRHLVVTAGKK